MSVMTITRAVPVKMLTLPVDVMPDGTYLLGDPSRGVPPGVLLRFDYSFLLVACAEDFVPPVGEKPYTLYLDGMACSPTVYFGITIPDGRKIEIGLLDMDSNGYVRLRVRVLEEGSYVTVPTDPLVPEVQLLPYEVPRRLQGAGYERLWVKKA